MTIATNIDGDGLSALAGSIDDVRANIGHVTRSIGDLTASIGHLTTSIQNLTASIDNLSASIDRPALKVDNALYNVSFSLMPPEILQNVAARLSWKYLRVLVTVCRSWNIALTPMLYSSIEIHDERQFKLLVKTVLTIAAHKQLGRLIHDLKIADSIDFAAIEFSMYLFPAKFRKRFDRVFRRKRGYVQLLPVLKDWINCEKIWFNVGFITSNDFGSSFYGDRLVRLSFRPQRGQDLEILLGLHALEELSIDGRASNLTLPRFSSRPIVGPLSRPSMGSLTVSYSYLEILHNNLTHLRSLQLIHVVPLGDVPRDIVVCNTVRRLQLDQTSSRMWRPYFAKKFSHLDELDLCIQAAMSIEGPSLNASFQKVKRVTCNDNHCSISALDSLHAIGVPVAALHPFDGSRATFKKAIALFHRTLTKISFSTQFAFQMAKLLNVLSACRSLMDLSLSVLAGPIEVDHVLDQLDRLECLKLSTNRIEVRNHRTQVAHRQLKKFEFSAKDVGIEVWVYLTQYCPCLVSISCHYLRKMVSAMVYYPHPGLRYLMVDAVRGSLYKLVRMSEEERIKHRNIDHRQLIQKHHHIRSIQWYGRTIKLQLKLLQLGGSELGELPYDSYIDKDDEKQFNSLPIISILCHYVDEIELDGFKLCNCARILYSTYDIQ